MDKYEKAEALAKRSIAYWSGLNGLEIKAIEYGIEDYVVCVTGAWGGQKKVHRVKIDYQKEGFRVDGYFVSLNDCIRM